MFDVLLNPGIRLMARLRLPAKFALISAAFLLPLGIALYGVISYANGSIRFAQLEQRGVEFVPGLKDLLSAWVHLRSDLASSASTAANSERADRALAELETLARTHSDALNVTDELSKLAVEWRGARSQPTLGAMDALIAHLLSVYAAVSDKSNLTLDPDLDSYYTMAFAMDLAPKLIDAAGRFDHSIRVHASGTALSATERAQLQFTAATASTYYDSAATALARAIRANDTLRDALPTTTWDASHTEFTAISRRLQQDGSGVSAEDGATALQVVEQTLVLAAADAKALDALLQKRIDGFEVRRNTLLATALAFVLLSAYFITSFYLSNLRGFAALSARMNKLARGDLSFNAPAEGRDEVSVLIDTFDLSRGQLQALILQIRSAADTIDTAGKQIAQANDDLSQRESAQSETVRETAAAIAEISTNVQRSLDNAVHGNRLAESAFGVATRGSEVVNQVVSTMNTITTSSRRIGDIIGVIDEIAFQTNLLALNAAVEAARAGEQGRGFAVVAGEVRNLAQRSATAASEIKKLIGESIQDVGAGAKLVNSAGVTMHDILQSVRQVSQIMVEITEASRHQTTDIKKFSDAMNRIDADCQQNAALVEETTAVAASLQDQVGQLSSSISRFTLDEQDASISDGTAVQSPHIDARLAHAA